MIFVYVITIKLIDAILNIDSVNCQRLLLITIVTSILIDSKLEFVCENNIIIYEK